MDNNTFLTYDRASTTWLVQNMIPYCPIIQFIFKLVKYVFSISNPCKNSTHIGIKFQAN